MKIIKDDLSDGKVIELMQSHLSEMHKYSPPESIHALDVHQMQSENITFWSARIDSDIAGCGALKELSAKAGEIKSMKTSPLFLRKGVARELLIRIISEAKMRGYAKLKLETGSHQAFIPAVSLYRSFGFCECGPFAGYGEDPHSIFMELILV